jgi:hypothetical protein
VVQGFDCAASSELTGIMSLRFTPLMQKRLTRRVQEMIERSLRHFPELDGKAITVGYTRKHLGSASVIYRAGRVSQLIIRLKVRQLTYQTIGHELIHLIQGMAHGVRSKPRIIDGQSIPSGEKQCDMWTLARDRLFCDDPPTYLRMPRTLREHWPDYADSVRELCIAAIAQRATQRRYIQWLETQVKGLPVKVRPEKPEPMQPSLPLDEC